MKEAANFSGELSKASLTQDGGYVRSQLEVNTWETEADVAHYNTSTRSEDVQKYVTPIPYDSGRTSRVHDQRFNQFGPELTKLGVVQRLAAAKGPIHTVTPQSTVYAASNTGAGIVFNNADDNKHEHSPGGSDTEEAAKPPVVTVGNFSDTDSGSVKSQSASSDGSYDSQDSATLRARLEEMYAMMKSQAKALEETRKAQELVNEERDKELKKAQEELKKLKEEKEAKPTQKELDDQVKSQNLRSARTTEVKAMAQIMKGYGAILDTRENYDVWGKELLSRHKAEGWPAGLVDMDAPEKDYSEETPAVGDAREKGNVLPNGQYGERQYALLKTENWCCL